MENQSLQTAAKQPERGKVTYQSGGQDVTLSYQMVRSIFAKGDSQVTDQDLTQFISLCKYNQLNPFLNEAYLVKFGTKPAQMIVSKEAYMKRAESCDTYDGMQAGVIVLRDNQVIELEGNFYLNTDKLLGGWAKVYRSDRKFPFVAKIRIEEYNKGRSTWNEIPSTMIAKVAKVQALREAFPAQFGAMYVREEVDAIEDARYEDVNKSVAQEIKENAGKEKVDLGDPEAPDQPEENRPIVDLPKEKPSFMTRP